jgi:hypothetical protein
MFKTRITKNDKLPELTKPLWDTEKLFLNELKPFLLSTLPYVGIKAKDKRITSKPDVITIHDEANGKASKTTRVKKEHKIEKIQFPVIFKSNTKQKPKSPECIKILCNPEKLKYARAKDAAPSTGTMHLILGPPLERLTPTSIGNRKLSSIKITTNSARLENVDMTQSFYHYPTIIRPYFHGMHQNGKLIGWREIACEAYTWESKYLTEQYHKDPIDKDQEKICIKYYSSCTKYKTLAHDKQVITNIPNSTITNDYKYPNRYLPTEERMKFTMPKQSVKDHLDLLLEITKLNHTEKRDLENINQEIQLADSKRTRSMAKQMAQEEKRFKRETYQIITNLQAK